MRVGQIASCTAQLTACLCKVHGRMEEMLACVVVVAIGGATRPCVTAAVRDKNQSRNLHALSSLPRPALPATGVFSCLGASFRSGPLNLKEPSRPKSLDSGPVATPQLKSENMSLATFPPSWPDAANLLLGLLFAGLHREQPPATRCHAEDLPGPMIGFVYTCHRISEVDFPGCDRGLSLLNPFAPVLRLRPEIRKRYVQPFPSQA